LAAVIAMAGCGSGSPQNATAPSGRFPVEVTASFPAAQRLAQHTHLVITVRNTGTKAIPDPAVTICNVTCTYPAPVGEGTSVKAFAAYLSMPGLASHSRAVWVVERPPGSCTGAAGYSCQNGGAGASTASDANTWQRGAPLKPGHTAVFDWFVTAVAPGRYTVAWEVAGDLYGSSRTVLGNGSIPRGTLPVTIAHAPSETYVNDAGHIVKQQ
jgi:hypothetical protein